MQADALTATQPSDLLCMNMQYSMRFVPIANWHCSQ